jgi:hypothetical protein
VLGVVVVILGAACAQPVAPQGGPTPAGTARSTPQASVNTDAVFQAPVTGVRAGPDPNSVLIQVTYPTDTGTCYGPPQVTALEEEDAVVFANVVMSPTGAASSGSCPAQGSATLTATAPIGTRAVSLNQELWRRTGDGYARCDPDLGCSPPADHCAMAWTLKAFNGLDVPRHAARDIEYCDQQWLVMTVNVNAAACGAGGRPGCSAPPNVSRYVFRFTGAWKLVTQSSTAGCARILAVAPDFPQDACKSLPATR